MARPALVIGMGGTGQWVMTYLKKDLLEIGRGKMPPGVRLLSFDTTKHASAVAGHDNKLEKDPNDRREKRAGAVQLDDQTEFVHFGSNLNNLVTEINQGRHRHLAWFNATDFIKKLPDASLNADDGAGAIRHVGRLCLIKDVQSRAESKIISKIEHAMTKIAAESAVTVQNRLEIVIIGSLAGGTGAGMLVDMPLLCREIASEKFHGNVVVRGFIITPRAFVSGAMGKGQDMLARSFAAWRELDRLLITSSEYGANQIKYSEYDNSLTLHTSRRLYDSTYIIDPMRQDNALDAGKPEEGIFPAIANVISAILDNTAGMTYSEQSINLSNTYFTLPLMPTHSAVGSFTMKVPVYYAQQKFTYSLAKEILDIMLAPVFNDQNRVIGLSDTSNAEVKADKTAMNAVLDFLSSDNFPYKGDTLPGTGLLRLIGKIRYNDAQENAEILTAVAKGPLSRQNAEFLLALTDVEQDQDGSAIITGVTKESRFVIWDEVPTSKVYGDTPDEAYNRLIKGIERARIQHYGIEKTDEKLRGTFGDELERAKQAQIRLFSALLRAYTEKTLNGDSVNVRMARRGKLGYLKSFYKNLVDALTYFNGFLTKVNLMRAEQLHIEDQAKGALAHTTQFYASERSKRCWVTFYDNFVHPEAHRAQRSYLMAAQREINVRKDNILLAVIEEAATEMKELAEKVLAEILRWETQLGVGEIKTVQLKDGTRKQTEIKSLYHAIQDELNNVEVNHALDKSLSQVSEVLGEHTYSSDPKFVDERLSKLEWKVSRDERKVPLADGKEVTQILGLKIDLHLNDPVVRQLRNTGEETIRDNLPAFVLMAEQPFARLVQEHPFAVEVATGDLNTGVALAANVNKKGEPLYRKTATGMGPLHRPYPRSALIRVCSNVSAETQNYFAEFQEHLEHLDSSVKVQLVESDDAYKLTLVRFDDVIRSEDFDIWEKCRDAYLTLTSKHNGDISAADLHVFPAEINACEYERKIAGTLKQNYRILHPDVVALLEDKQRIEMFFRALALGFIQKEESSSGQYYWVYQIKNGNKIQLTDPKKGFFGTEDNKYFFRLINQFVVKAVDVREGYTQANWIDFGKLEQEILDQHRQLGTAKVKALYKRQPGIKGGMIQEIRDYIAREREKEQNPDLRERIAKDHEDLANLAETIYLNAAERGF